MEALAETFDRQLIGLGIGLAIGFLVGLEREWADDKPVGVRSFLLIAAAGGLSALFLDVAGGWPIGAGLIAMAVILTRQARRDDHSGSTTLIAALAVYLLGAAAVAGYWLESLVIGGAAIAALHLKQPLHGWVERLGDDDLKIIVRFVVIALVILPVLPNRTFGPYDVFNPFTTWLLVVLIVGMNLAGYVAFRLVGTGAGGWLAGALGGLASSTATTISFAGLSRRNEQMAPVAALVILVASAVVYARVIVEVAIVAPGLVSVLAAPGVVFGLILLGLGGVAYRQFGGGETEMPTGRNPARIRQALTFAAIYAAILFGVAAARDLLGEDAIYAVAVISGLTDVDALTLSVAQLHGAGKAGIDTAWRAIFLATLSNLAFKTAAASLIGSAALRRWILSTGAVALAAGIAILVLWP